MEWDTNSLRHNQKPSGAGSIRIDVDGRILKSDEKALLLGYEPGTFIHPGKEMDQAFFVSAVSHELFTPLTALLGLVQMAKDGIYVHDSLEKMEHHLQKMNRIIEQLILLSKIDSGQYLPQFIPIDLGELITEVLHDLQYRILDKALEIQLEAKGTISSDRGGLKIIIRNLISNAIKYSHPGGIVDIKADPQQFACQDEGIGIPKRDVNRIGSQFFRGENVRRIQGSGLGLSIVRKIAQVLDIDFKIQSQENIGTKVFLRFPSSLVGSPKP